MATNTDKGTPKDFPPLYLPAGLNLSAALLDTSMFMRYRYFARELSGHLGNPQIYHTDITVKEWRNYFTHKEFSDEAVERLTTRALNAFGSSYLPELPVVKAIAGEITSHLLKAGIAIETSNGEPGKKTNDERDIEIFAHGVAHGIDVVSNDKLFFPMGELFHTGIKAHVNIKRTSQRWIRQLQEKLAAEGIGKVGMPIDLTHLLE